MAETKYDRDEKDKELANQPASHADNMTAAERRAEVDNLEKQFAAPAAGEGENTEGTQKAGLSPEQIESAESKPDNPAEAADSDQLGRGYNPKDAARSRIAIKGLLAGGRRKKALIGGGIGLAIAGFLISAFLSILPLKILHMVENLQKHFYATSENAVNAESEKMLSSYMKKYVTPSLTRCSGSTIDKNCNTIVGDGNNPVKNLYRAWSQAKLENKLADKYGIELVYKPNKSSIGGRYFLKSPGYANSNGQDITNFVNPANPDLFNQDLFDQLEPKTRNEVRREVQSAFENESKWKRVMYRFKVGRLLEEKYGIKRCIVACKVKDDFSDWKDDKKIAAKSIIIQRVVEPHTEVLGLVLQCVIGGEDCTKIADGEGVNGEKQSKFQKDLQAKLDAIAQKYGQEAVDKIIADARILEKKGFTKYAVEKVVELVFNQFASEEASQTAANAAGDVIPVVGAINTTASVIKTVENGTKNIKYMAYAANAAAMVQLYMVYRTHADEIKSGHVDSELVGSFTQTLAPDQKYNPDTKQMEGVGAEGTPLYSALIDGTPPSTKTALLNNIFPSASAATATTDDTVYKCDSGKGVPASQLICPEESLKQRSFWSGIADLFKKPPLSVVAAIANAWNSTAGKLISFVGNTFGDIISQFPGIKQLGDTVGNVIQPLLESVVNYIIPSPISDNMSGGRSFDLMAGGADVSGNDFAHHGLGGKMLTNQQVTTILNQQNQADQAQFDHSSFFAKMFDKNSDRSLVTKVAMAMPTNLSTAISSGASSLLHNPLGTLASAFGSIFTSHSYAANATDMCTKGGPFGVTCYGYTDADINAIGDPETYWDQHCQTPVQTDAWNNAATTNENPDTAQLENNTTDPCLLIQSTVGSTGGYFSDSTLTADDLADSGSSGGGGAPVGGNVYQIGDSLSVGMSSYLPADYQNSGFTLDDNPVQATVGINVANSIAKLQADADKVRSASVVVVELGTNNCSLSGTPTCMATPAFENEIKNMVGAIRGISPSAQIFWVNIYTTKGPAYQSINQAITNQSGPLNYKVVDWAKEATTNSSKYKFDSDLGVHQTSGNGYSSMAQFVVGSLR